MKQTSKIHFSYATHSDLTSSINWIACSLDYGMSSDIFSRTFPVNERIMDIMMPDDASWDNNHHSQSLPNSIEDNLSDLYEPNIVEFPMNCVSIHEVDSEKNLSNIKANIPLDILIKPSIVKNIHISASCSPDEIKTYKALFQEF